MIALNDNVISSQFFFIISRFTRILTFAGLRSLHHVSRHQSIEQQKKAMFLASPERSS